MIHRDQRHNYMRAARELRASCVLTTAFLGWSRAADHPKKLASVQTDHPKKRTTVEARVVIRQDVVGVLLVGEAVGARDASAVLFKRARNHTQNEGDAVTLETVRADGGVVVDGPDPRDREEGRNPTPWR